MADRLPSVISLCKPQITRGNVTRGNLPHMDKNAGWELLEHPWERLKWARMRRFDRAKDAAESMNMKDTTYGAYERPPESSKHIPLDHQKAIKYGRKFGVRWEWLLEGRGDPFMAPPGSPAERVLEALNSSDPDRQEELANVLVQMIKATGTHG